MNALFYPFHLCQERTLHRLLQDYEAVHFRDFMALQLTPMMGTTAFPDRMGDYYPEWLRTGQIIQGHNVSGPMSAEMIQAVNRDLTDATWRSLFHEALLNNYRFQRGLFDQSQIASTTNEMPDTHSILSNFTGPGWKDRPFQVDCIKRLSRSAHRPKDGPLFEYGWALVKTSASLIHTIQLCHTLKVMAVTDSLSHHQLLSYACERDGIELTKIYLDPKDGNENVDFFGDKPAKGSGRAG